MKLSSKFFKYKFKVKRIENEKFIISSVWMHSFTVLLIVLPEILIFLIIFLGKQEIIFFNYWHAKIVVILKLKKNVMDLWSVEAFEKILDLSDFKYKIQL